MLKLARNPEPTDAEVVELRRRLDEFYRATDEYTAFSAPPDNSAHFARIEPYLRQLIEQRGHVRVLELGAGMPTFPLHFSGLRDRFEYHAQDVTPQNLEHIRKLTDHVHIGDIASIDGTFDLIFSLYVLEHVSTPRDFLQHISRLLAPGGIHVVICPRYDMPGYLCPSLRHLSAWKRAKAVLFLAGSRIRARLDGRPRFWVNCDPAMFHVKWYRDADAVHVVSEWDVARWHRDNGFEVQRMPGAGGWRNWILRRFLTVALACRKTGLQRGDPPGAPA